MRKINLITTLIILTLSGFCSYAQELMSYQQPKEYEMPKGIIPTARKYWVSLPKEYDETTNRYPIIFLFDGNEEYLRNVVLFNVDELTHYVQMPPCIIVGLVQRNRSLDFGPLYAIKNSPNADKVNGDKFFDFLKTELLPELKKNYRTQDFKLGIGHSLGGLFLTYCFTKDPEFFNGIIAVSPAIELKRDSALMAGLKNTLKSKLDKQTFYCWASGTIDVNEVAFKPGSVELHKLFDNTPNPSFHYNYIDLPGKTHNVTPLFSMLPALEFIFNDWDIACWYRKLFYDKTVEPISYLKERIKMNKKIYGFDMDPTEDRMLDNVGNTLEQQKQYEKALPYNERALQMAPGNAGYYYDLGKVQEGLKQYDKALSNYKTAIEKLDKSSEVYKDIVEMWQADIKRVEAIVHKP